MFLSSDSQGSLGSWQKVHSPKSNYSSESNVSGSRQTVQKKLSFLSKKIEEAQSSEADSFATQKKIPHPISKNFREIFLPPETTEKNGMSAGSIENAYECSLDDVDIDDVLLEISENEVDPSKIVLKAGRKYYEYEGQYIRLEHLVKHATNIVRQQVEDKAPKESVDYELLDKLEAFSKIGTLRQNKFVRVCHWISNGIFGTGNKKRIRKARILALKTLGEPHRLLEQQAKACKNHIFSSTNMKALENAGQVKIAKGGLELETGFIPSKRNYSRSLVKHFGSTPFAFERKTPYFTAKELENQLLSKEEMKQKTSSLFGDVSKESMQEEQEALALRVAKAQKKSRAAINAKVKAEEHNQYVERLHNENIYSLKEEKASKESAIISKQEDAEKRRNILKEEKARALREKNELREQRKNNAVMQKLKAKRAELEQEGLNGFKDEVTDLRHQVAMLQNQLSMREYQIDTKEKLREDEKMERDRLVREKKMCVAPISQEGAIPVWNDPEQRIYEGSVIHELPEETSYNPVEKHVEEQNVPGLEKTLAKPKRMLVKQPRIGA